MHRFACWNVFFTFSFDFEVPWFTYIVSLPTYLLATDAVRFAVKNLWNQLRSGYRRSRVNASYPHTPIEPWNPLQSHGYHMTIPLRRRSEAISCNLSAQPRTQRHSRSAAPVTSGSSPALWRGHSGSQVGVYIYTKLTSRDCFTIACNFNHYMNHGRNRITSLRPRRQLKSGLSAIGFEAGVKALVAELNYDDVDQCVACYAYVRAAVVLPIRYLLLHPPKVSDADWWW